MTTQGEIAYNAYCQARNWLSVRNEPLPTFIKQAPEVAAAREAAACAVVGDVSRLKTEINQLSDELASEKSARRACEREVMELKRKLK